MINFYQSEIYTRKFFSIKKFEISVTRKIVNHSQIFQLNKFLSQINVQIVFFPCYCFWHFFFLHSYFSIAVISDGGTFEEKNYEIIFVLTKLTTIIMRNVILAMFLTYREISFQLKDLCRFMGLRCMEWCRVPFSIKCVGGEEKITFEFLGFLRQFCHT